MAGGLTKWVYEGAEIRADKNGMICLTDMWKAVGSPKNHNPNDWVRLDVTQALIKAFTFSTAQDRVLRATKGRTGGTWAATELAIAYAEYLSPEFHVWVTKLVKQHFEWKADPELGYDHYKASLLAKWRSEGKSEAWIQERIEGKEVRNAFTQALARHGLKEQAEYAGCTNAVYRPLLGGTSKQIRKSRNLPAKAKLRDNLSKTELMALKLAEQLAEDWMDEDRSQGFEACESVCYQSGEAVGRAIKERPRPRALTSP